MLTLIGNHWPNAPARSAWFEVHTSVEAPSGNEDVRPDRARRRCGTNETFPLHCRPPKARLPQYCSVVEDTAIHAFLEKIDAIAYASHSRCSIGRDSRSVIAGKIRDVFGQLPSASMP